MSNERYQIHLISARHSISRAKFLRIGDMTQEQVNSFLAKRKIPENLYAKTYHLVGGRINHLKLFVVEISDNGLSFDGYHFILTEGAKEVLMDTYGSTLLENWEEIDEKYRPTCKKIIFFAFTRLSFDESELAESLTTGWWSRKDDVRKSVESLVRVNILSKIGVGTYSLHSKVETEYLASNMSKFR